MSEKVKDYTKKLWLDTQGSRAKLNVQQVQQQIRSKRREKREKLFQPEEYPTLHQIEYRTRKVSQEYGITAQQQHIADIVELDNE